MSRSPLEQMKAMWRLGVSSAMSVSSVLVLSAIVS
jgi:hypothetical protein